MMEISDHELRERLIARGFNPPPVTDTSRSLLIKKLKKLDGGIPIISSINSHSDIDQNEGRSRRRTLDSSPEKYDKDSKDAKIRQTRSSRKDADKVDAMIKKNLSYVDNSYNGTDPFERGSDSDDSVSYGKNNSRSSLLARKPLSVRRETEYFSSPSYKKFDINNGATSYLNRNTNRGRYSYKGSNSLNKLTNFLSSPTSVLMGMFVFFLFVVGIYYFKDDRLYGELSVGFSEASKCSMKGKQGVSCILDSEIDEAFNYLKILYHSLWKKEQKIGCGDINSGKTSMSEIDVIELLVHESGLLRYEAEKIVKNIRILVKTNPQFNVIWSGNDHSFRLENAELPWSCTFKSWFKSLMGYAFYVVVAVLLIFSMHALQRWAVTRVQERARETQDLIKGILDILQQNAIANPSQTYLPIVHVREQLISYADRERKRKMWLDAVKYVEENESRVRKEILPFQGEDYDVWRWIGGNQISAPKPKTWQGEAFETSKDTMNTPSTSPTPCLKIRHMFDPKNEIADDDWGTGVKDAILERCEGVNIVHMMVDETSPEGCVYIKCASAEDAGKAYRKIHGAWFDGKIVTVKYLRLERYHERFPASVGLTKPLIPSNDLKRSLA